PGERARKLRSRGARPARRADAERGDALSARALSRLDGVATDRAAARLSRGRSRRAGTAGGASGRRRRAGAAERRWRDRGRARVLARRSAQADRVEEGGAGARDRRRAGQPRHQLVGAPGALARMVGMRQARPRAATLASRRVDARRRSRRRRLWPSAPRHRHRSCRRRCAARALSRGIGAVALSAADTLDASPLATMRRALPRWPGWERLPREARDTLFLLAVIGWTVLPHASHLPAWSLALTAAVLLWRARLALINAALPGRWVLMGVLVAALALTFWSYRTLLGKEPGVTLAVALMALKTLELRARRDAFVVFFLGFFIVLTHFLYSQSIAVAIAMLVSVWGLMTALVLAHMPVGQPSLARASGLAARTALLGAPVMVLLFVLFPRIGPLWGVPQDGISKTGLSNTMKLGSMTEVAADDAIAMRIRFDGQAPPPAQMYFRGP